MHAPSDERKARLGDAETILDSITDAFYSLDDDWRFCFVNRHAEITLGHAAADLFGKRIWDMFPGTVGNIFEETYRKAAQERVSLTFDSYYPDHERWYEVNVYPAPGGLSVYFRDVTERERRELRRNALRVLSDRLTGLATPEEIAYTASELLGLTLGVGRVGYGTVDPAGETLLVERGWHASGVDGLAGVLPLRDFGAVVDDLKLGKTVAIADVEADARTRTAAARLQAHSAASFVNVPVVEQGHLVALVFVHHARPRAWPAEELAFIEEAAGRARAASERMRNEAALQASEARFRTMANAMPQMVWSTMPDGYHDYFNEQWYEFTGIARGTTDGDEWNRLFHPDDQQRAWTVWQHSLRTGEPYEIQYRLRHRSGDYRWTLGRALPVRGASGDVLRWMGTCTDIHDQKLAEERLTEADIRKDEFLAMLAHELRNPLAPISAAAQLLQLGALDEGRVRQTSQIIGRQVRHMTSLVDDLMDVSRVTRGLVELDNARVDIGHVVADAIEQVTPLLRTRHHRLGLQLAPDAPFVLGDRKRLVQVVVNLLNNAAKYTPEGGHLALDTEVDDARVLIRVTDDGIGMTPELAARAFDMFAQAARSPDRSSGGLGLGLALVRSLVTLHGGTVSGASPGLGRGSVFTVRLPRMLQGVPRSVTKAADPPLPARAAPLRILVVDDNADAASMVSMLLEARGHAVRTEHGSRAALAHAAAEAPQVCILDIGLPELDGNELAQRLRALPRMAHAVLIAVTGYGQDDDRRRTLAAGFDHHLVKPVDTVALDAILAGLRFE